MQRLLKCYSQTCISLVLLMSLTCSTQYVCHRRSSGLPKTSLISQQIRFTLHNDPDFLSGENKQRTAGDIFYR